MNVSSLMNRNVHSCRATDTLTTACRIMWEHDCGWVPVLDEHSAVQGVLTDRDACMAAFTQGSPMWAIPVSTAMSRRVMSCAAGDSLDDVERLMKTERIRRVPVLDEAGRLIGMLTLGDLAREAAREGGRRHRELPSDDVVSTFAAICEPRLLEQSPRA